MKSARGRRTAPAWLAFCALAVVLLFAQSCAPAATMAPAAPEEAEAEPKAEEVVQPTKASQPEEPQSTRIRPTQPPAAAATAAPVKPEPIIEDRAVELEWPDRMRLGDSDVIRLSLVPVKDGYVARAEFPDHALQTREVPVPRPNGYELYALAQLDGVGFEIDPRGEQERFVPEDEEVAWRWTLAPRNPGELVHFEPARIVLPEGVDPAALADVFLVCLIGELHDGFRSDQCRAVSAAAEAKRQAPDNGNFKLQQYGEEEIIEALAKTDVRPSVPGRKFTAETAE